MVATSREIIRKSRMLMASVQGTIAESRCLCARQVGTGLFDRFAAAHAAAENREAAAQP